MNGIVWLQTQYFRSSNVNGIEKHSNVCYNLFDVEDLTIFSLSKVVLGRRGRTMSFRFFPLP